MIEASSLADLLFLAAERETHGETIIFTDGPRLSLSQICDSVTRTAGALANLGVRRGDRVAIMIQNRQEFIWVYFAASYLGAVSVPMNTEWRGMLLEHVLRETTPTVIVTEALFEREVRRAHRQVGGTGRFLVVRDHAVDSDSDFHAAIIGAPEASFETTKVWDLATIMYTSGTTGRSKGIMHCNGMSLGFASNTSECMSYGASDTIHNCLPLFHGNALFVCLLAALQCGSTAVFSPRFSASRWWPELREFGVTATSMLGAMPQILWNRPRSNEERDHQVRIVLATPAPLHNFEEFEQRYNVSIASLYGETDVAIPILTPPNARMKPGTVGVVHRDWEAKIVDEHDREIPHGSVGELIVRPRRPWITQLGYWGNPEATVAAWRNSWFHTGDRLQRDDEGWFRFIDRAKDAIRRSGENISSYEVETALEAHEAVTEAAVYPVPADMAEDEVMAAVILVDGAEMTPELLFEHCKTTLPYFAIPRYIRVVNEFPRTPTEKVRKEVLRAEAITAETWDGGPIRRSRVAAAGRPAAN